MNFLIKTNRFKYSKTHRIKISMSSRESKNTKKKKKKKKFFFHYKKFLKTTHPSI